MMALTRKLFVPFLLVIISTCCVWGGNLSSNHTKVLKKTDKKVYVHLMPWFETRESSPDGQWGIHWKMATQNPDIIVGEDGKRQIASYYYPENQLYASGDGHLIDYQIQMMKYAGIDGVFIDWPGTAQAWDYPKNARNADAFIQKLDSSGLEFAIVYEDHNLGMLRDAGLISDIHQQGRQDMQFLQDNYFHRNNYVKVDNAPLLMTFGPQTLTVPSDWDNVFSVLQQKPTFLTLWYQQQQAGNNAKGEYCWIYSDFMDGLKNFYNNHPLNVKIGGAYPGFNTFYSAGGWGGPTWQIPVSVDTFAKTLDLALGSSVKWIQVATWNDYGEGTMIEPTREFGNGFLNALQNRLGVAYSDRELNLVKAYYLKRKQYAKSEVSAHQVLDEVYDALNAVMPDRAKELLNGLA
eukprot:Colp12_sorted_trinity150504_noHs@14653